MKKSLNHEAVDVNITGQRLCRPEEGLPAVTMCNTFAGPGVDPKTNVVRRIAGGNGDLPGTQLTENAKKTMDLELSQAEGMVHRTLVDLIHFTMITRAALATIGWFMWSCCKKKALHDVVSDGVSGVPDPSRRPSGGAEVIWGIQEVIF